MNLFENIEATVLTNKISAQNEIALLYVGTLLNSMISKNEAHSAKM